MEKVWKKNFWAHQIWEVLKFIFEEAISSRGVISLYILEQNLTADLYVRILKSRVNQLNKLYSEGFYFRHDNDPKHKSKIAASYTQSAFMEVLEWSPYSSDLKPNRASLGLVKTQSE